VAVPQLLGSVTGHVFKNYSGTFPPAKTGLGALTKNIFTKGTRQKRYGYKSILGDSMQTKTSEYSQDSKIALGLPEEVRREVFEATFPELKHISDSSSHEDRETAVQRLNSRLGIPSTLGVPSARP